MRKRHGALTMEAKRSIAQNPEVWRVITLFLDQKSEVINQRNLPFRELAGLLGFDAEHYSDEIDGEPGLDEAVVLLNKMESLGVLESKEPRLGEVRQLNLHRNFRLTEEARALARLENLEHLRDIFGPDIDPSLLIDSRSWTGIPKNGELSGLAVRRLLMALKIVDDAVEKSAATNSERAQARAYVIALQALVEAPEPPADIVFRIITTAAALASVGAFFGALVALYR